MMLKIHFNFINTNHHQIKMEYSDKIIVKTGKVSDGQTETVDGYNLTVVVMFLETKISIKL